MELIAAYVVALITIVLLFAEGYIAFSASKKRRGLKGQEALNVVTARNKKLFCLHVIAFLLLLATQTMTFVLLVRSYNQNQALQQTVSTLQTQVKGLMEHGQ